MKLIKTEDAVGQILCHDITQIIKDKVKDAVFRKGHVITEEDIPVLLSVGKEHIYIWEDDENMLHENDAAQILYELSAGKNFHPTQVKEGKIELIADVDGVLKIRRDALQAVNSLGDMMIASRHGDFTVRAGDKVAGTRIIPLIIEKNKMEEARTAAGDEPIFEVKPFVPKKVGIIATGSEIYCGRIEDTFTPVIEEKLAEFPADIIDKKICNDEPGMIAEAIEDLLEAGAELVLCTGGMSVDPDDRTPGAIKRVAAEIVTYGAPVLPGAMCCLGYSDKGIPIMGLPGCVMYSRRSIFDLVLPRIMVDEKLTNQDFVKYGEGGLCLNCEACTFPNCGFGK